MTWTPESVLSFAPDSGWTADFTDRLDNESWSLPVIGWAVLVNAYEDTDDADEAARSRVGPRTSLQAVVLAEATAPMPVPAYLDTISPGSTSWVDRYSVRLRRGEHLFGDDR